MILGFVNVKAQAFRGNAFVAKFRSEAVRYVLESEKSEQLKWPFELKALVDENNQEHLNRLISALLFEGPRERDKLYVQRVADFGKDLSSKDLRKAVHETFKARLENDDGSISVFWRRFGEPGVFNKLKGSLSTAQREQLEKKKSEILEANIAKHRLVVERLFRGISPERPPAQEFLTLWAKAQEESWFDAHAFKQAVRIAFKQIAPQDQDAFVRSFAEHEEAIRTIRELLNEEDSGLERILEQHEVDKLTETIRSHLCSGNDSAREELKRLLVEQTRKNPGLKAVTTEAAHKCLTDPAGRDSFYGTFMLTNSEAAKLRILDNDSVGHLNHLFASLEPAMQQKVIGFLLEKDKEMFDEMVRRGYDHLKNHPDQPVFRAAVFTFLLTPAGESSLNQLAVGLGVKSSVVKKKLSAFAKAARQFQGESKTDVPDEKDEQEKPQEWISTPWQFIKALISRN